MSPYKCPSTAQNVLNPARAGCQRSVKCWSHLFFFLFFFLNFKRHCLWQHFLRCHITRLSTVATTVQVGTKKVFFWWLPTQLVCLFPGLFGVLMYLVCGSYTTKLYYTVQKSCTLMSQCTAWFLDSDAIYYMYAKVWIVKIICYIKLKSLNEIWKWLEQKGYCFRAFFYFIFQSFLYFTFIFLSLKK